MYLKPFGQPALFHLLSPYNTLSFHAPVKQLIGIAQIHEYPHYAQYHFPRVSPPEFSGRTGRRAKAEAAGWQYRYRNASAPFRLPVNRTAKP